MPVFSFVPLLLASKVIPIQDSCLVDSFGERHLKKGYSAEQIGLTLNDFPVRAASRAIVDVRNHDKSVCVDDRCVRT